MLVGRSFGLFGIVVPIIVTMMGARILRRRPVLFHHSVLSSLLVLILGSLTLGARFLLTTGGECSTAAGAAPAASKWDAC